MVYIALFMIIVYQQLDFLEDGDIFELCVFLYNEETEKPKIVYVTSPYLIFNI
jgi:hypothetical protein